MHPRSCPVKLTVLLPRADYRVYESAARKLKRIMGRRAPDALCLIQFNLQGQDARGITDYYLDRIGWPPSAGRAVTLRHRPPTGPAKKPAPLAKTRLLPLPGATRPADLSRN